MGCTAHAGSTEENRAEAADTRGAGCLFELRERQDSRRHRFRWKTCGGCRRHEPGADAAFRGRMEIAIRRQEPAFLSLPRAAKTPGRAIDACGSFAPGGPVSRGQ